MIEWIKWKLGIGWEEVPWGDEDSEWMILTRRLYYNKEKDLFRFTVKFL